MSSLKQILLIVVVLILLSLAVNGMVMIIDAFKLHEYFGIAGFILLIIIAYKACSKITNYNVKQ